MKGQLPWASGVRTNSRLLALAFLVLASLSLSYGQAVNDTALATLLSRAYALLAINSPEAPALFERAVELDSSNVLVRKQLGYLYQANGKFEEALGQFVAADRMQPSDSTKLQVAYVLSALGRSQEATELLHTLQASPYPDIRDGATNQLASSSPTGSAAESWTRLYAAPYYDTRWNTTFFQANFERGYSLTSDRKLGAYGTVMYSGDARSSGGQAPVIFSDNAIIFALGLRIHPLTGLTVSIQEGAAFDMIDRGSGRIVHGDFRAVAIYGWGIYAPYNYHTNLKLPARPFADLYSSFGYYSRYTDAIGYVQGRAGLRMLEAAKTAGDVYVRADFVGDTQKQFYNNQSEGSIGARIIPNVDWGLYLVGEFHRGRYWNVSDTPLPYDPYYSSFRFFLIIDRTF